MAARSEVAIRQRVFTSAGQVRVCGLILAGGSSSRMGRPKALLPIEGQTFVDRLAHILGANCAEVIVVLGYEAESIGPAMRNSATIVVNPDPSRGQLSSLKCGLQAISSNFDAFMFTPVDYPAIEQDTVARVIAAGCEQVDWDLVIPVHNGRRGHPVLCRIKLATEFLELGEQAQAREVVHRHLDRAVLVDVDDAGTVQDVDDPAAYERLLASRI